MTGQGILDLLEAYHGEVDGEPVQITDTDLIEQIRASGHMKATIIRVSAKIQLERNKTRDRREMMTPIQRRRDMAREAIVENLLEKTDIHHIHSVLALCGLPYKRTPDEQMHYIREYGKSSLVVQAGFLKHPDSGKIFAQGLPYGPKARLLLLHICTRAMRQQSPVVDLENSLSAFIESMGVHKCGGKRGSFKQFKEQINRLAACRMQIGLWNGSRSVTINTQPISRLDLWLPQNPDQKMLWNSSVTLSHDFYESLQQHALPVDIRALSALSHSAKQMDILLWLSYRLKELKKPYFLTWDLMKEQFCHSPERRMILFQNQFREDIRDIEEIFDKRLPLELSDKGLTLKPCDPEGLFVPPEKHLPK